MLDRETWMAAQELPEGFPLVVEELSSSIMTGPPRCRSNSRRDTQTASWAMLS